ncbi:uncharacterized protein E0L32_002174 [Thyridium curvatum]|uniref:Heterokaryon incompatibility domain-containing protein n=1 Tax=Thyridium curvatum TaxID=1093900 RepID=A0A507ALK7_9PEZI|nr:uncharacterized protein E0L32_001959 [Thyridium curvatum]XP_030989282.1 uncharacterized protein E0L32_002174 [Thyridium curvatum]TPX07356.1 hypothetical protein E0L32_001959 [Thyridium curvatum]TPX07571.1 hypothetical protein E0L32_002174 [Thyridium curvatum]
MTTGVKTSGDGRPKEHSTERETSSIASAPVHGLSPMEKCAIYPESLDLKQFRLACISPAVDHDNAIHISLETYVHDDCPEYEASSYTWGGENNVSTPCQPVYVGTYWDLILQTQNCWAMLRYMRPTRGLRLVWVDAICINQDDIQERDSQVSIMGQIYKGCSRVFVWLGQDLVAQPKDRYPPRHRLEELEISTSAHLHVSSTTGRLDIRQLLERRYFSRLWVIQELILPPRAIIPIGDKLFWADTAMFTRLEEYGLKWDRTAAPYIQRPSIAKSTYSRSLLPSGNLCSLMALTSQSQASDLRDRLHAVLGLCQDKSNQIDLRPGYDLSHQHIFIGFFAYCILIQHQTEVLLNACGPIGSEPSWVPGWRTQASWECTFPGKSGETVDLFNSQLTMNRLLVAVREARSWTRDANIVQFVRHDDPRCDMDDPEHTYETDDGKEIRAYRLKVRQTRPWHLGATVNSETGALSINLTKVTTISSRPKLLGYSGAFGLFEIPIVDKDSHARRAMYMATKNSICGVVRPGQDEAFVLDTGQSQPLIYLILRRIGCSRRFKLLASSHVVCFVSLYKIRDCDWALALDCLQSSGLYEPLQHAGEFFSQPPGLSMKQALGRNMGGEETWTFLPAMIEGAKARKEDRYADVYDSAAEDLYLSMIDPKLEPKIVDDRSRSGEDDIKRYVELRFRQRDWETCSTLYTGSTGPLLVWEWCLEGKTRHWRDITIIRPVVSWEHYAQRLVLRCQVQELFDSTFGIWSKLKDKLDFYGLYNSGKIGTTSQEVEARLRAGPTEEDYFIACHLETWSEDMFKHLKLDGDTYQVCIE